MKTRLAAIWIAILIAPGASSIFSEEVNENKTLVNRRVLILDFVNVRNSEDYSYLEDSLPESFLDPLSRTKSFELLPRTIWGKYVSEKTFQKKDAYKENIAIDAGKKAGADVVLIGQYIALEDRIQIFAKAIELSTGRLV
jgi:TolB-like protein